jgi:hypothetical protein
MKDEYLKKHARWLSEGQIGRRQFIRAAIAAGLAVPSALTLATDVLAATPKKGGKTAHGFILWLDHGLRWMQERPKTACRRLSSMRAATISRKSTMTAS